MTEMLVTSGSYPRQHDWRGQIDWNISTTEDRFREAHGHMPRSDKMTITVSLTADSVRVTVTERP